MSEAMVRTAGPADGQGMLDLCRMHHAEIASFTFSESKAIALIKRALASDGAIAGVIGPVGSPVAITILSIAEIQYTDEKMLTDFTVFVHPDHRHSGYAKLLLQFAKKVRDALQMPLLMGVMGQKPGNLFDLADERMGRSGRREAQKLSPEAAAWRSRLSFYRSQFGDPIGFSFFSLPEKPSETAPDPLVVAPVGESAHEEAA